LTTPARATPGVTRAGRRIGRFDGPVRQWWDGARRERDQLPWRVTRDPWEVLVAEIMLAQTQVERVTARYGPFVTRFPTPASCAGAPLGEVVRAWVGLGFNRRAVALHSAAEAIVRVHDGKVPRTLADLVALAGVGPYTARAVLVFAFDAEVAAVDTNVGRVLARAAFGRRLRPGEVQSLADTLVPAGSARAWNLALMDFGSLVCSSRQPACGTCPVRAADACAWRAGHAGDPDPALGSARVTSRQSRFEGSDRQGRGRLVRAACAGAIAPDDVARAAGWPSQAARAQRVAAALVAEGILGRGPSGELWLA
jgi:A/G-specific adenine glycosylase